MSTFADADTIAEHTQIGAKAAGKAEKFVPQASAELKSLITPGTYEDVVSSGNGGTYDQCEQAESLLALSFALPFLNLRPTDRGGLSKIIGLDSQTSEELMGIHELKKYAGMMRNQAIELVADLIPDIEDEETAFFGPFGVAATTNFAQR